jgi:cellulose synthase/poly-beta-1,6-N-acetylglucosamine synthase-like glycosyltransferase
MPQVSVVTSVYNGETYLEECVDSILNQTFEDFEYIILNNGSTDGTAMILQRYTDPRLRVIHQENLGISRSLNKGINLSDSSLIVRLDADDYSFPQRLEKQIAFMKKYPDVVLCGSRRKELLGDKILPSTVPFIEKDEDIRKTVSCYNPLSHSTIMFRKKSFIEAGGYNDRFKYAQDYSLWLRMLALGKANNLKEELSVVRISQSSTSNQNIKKQKFEELQIRWKAFCQFGGNPGKALFYSLRGLARLIFPSKKHLNR